MVNKPGRIPSISAIDGERGVQDEDVGSFSVACYMAVIIKKIMNVLVKEEGRHATLAISTSVHISVHRHILKDVRKKRQRGVRWINYPPETSSPFAQGSKMNRPKPHVLSLTSDFLYVT